MHFQFAPFNSHLACWSAGPPHRGSRKWRPPLQRRVRPCKASADTPGQAPYPTPQVQPGAWVPLLRRYCQVSVSAASLLAINHGIKHWFTAIGTAVPPTLAGMLMTFVLLTAAAAASERTAAVADAITHFYAPLRDWVARWMPVFFVPSLIVLPNACSGMTSAQLVKMVQVTLGGWLGSILLATAAVRLLRGAAGSDISAQEVRCLLLTWHLRGLP